MTNNTPDYTDNLYFEEKKMSDLTEQWKKGELINGKKYYITFFDSEPFEATFRTFEAMIPYWRFEANGKQYCDENGYDCVKVLAPVPTFDEWKAKLRALDAAHKTIKMEDETINRLVCSGKQLNYKNAKLKELLKECELWFTGIVGNMNDKNVGEHNRSVPIGNFEHIFKEFSQKIDEVLK